MQLLSTIPYHQTGALGDHEEREILADLLDVTTEEGDLLQIMEMTGRFVETDSVEYFNYTDSFLYESVTCDDVGGTSISQGSEGTVTVSDSSRIREDEIVMLTDGSLGYVRSVDSGTAITVYAIDAFAPSENEVLTFPTNAIEEGGAGSHQPDTDLTKRSNKIQIFESSKSVSDLHKAGKTVLRMPNGKRAYFYKLENDVYKKHRLDIGNAFIVGKKDEFARDSGGSSKVRLTRGLNSYIADMGGVKRQTAAGDGTLAKADFKTFSRALDHARSPKDGFLWAGGDINAEIDDTFDTLMDQGNINYNIFGKGDGKKKAVELGMNTFTVYGRTFRKNFLTCLDHPKVTAASGAKWPNYAYYVPTDKVRGQDGNMVDRIRGRYLGIDGVNSRWHPKYLGGLAPNPTERANKFEISITSWEGLEIVGTEQLGRLELT